MKLRRTKCVPFLDHIVVILKEVPFICNRWRWLRYTGWLRSDGRLFQNRGPCRHVVVRPIGQEISVLWVLIYLFWVFFRAFRTTLRHAESIYKRTHSALDWSKFKSLRNHYHHLILDAKKQYFSKLVSSSSDNPRRLWQTVNKLLNRKSALSLPSSSAATSIADRFASFVTDKISKLRLSLANNSSSTSPHSPSPPVAPPDFSFLSLLWIWSL